MNTVAQMQFMNQLKQRIKYGGGGGGVDAYNRLENEPHCLQYLYIIVQNTIVHTVGTHRMEWYHIKYKSVKSCNFFSVRAP